MKSECRNWLEAWPLGDCPPLRDSDPTSRPVPAPALRTRSLTRGFPSTHSQSQKHVRQFINKSCIGNAASGALCVLRAELSAFQTPTLVKKSSRQQSVLKGSSSPSSGQRRWEQMSLGQWDRHHHKSPSGKWLILGTDTQVTYSSPVGKGEPIKTMTGKNPSQDVNCEIDYNRLYISKG